MLLSVELGKLGKWGVETSIEGDGVLVLVVTLETESCEVTSATITGVSGSSSATCRQLMGEDESESTETVKSNKELTCLIVYSCVSSEYSLRSELASCIYTF